MHGWILVFTISPTTCSVRQCVDNMSREHIWTFQIHLQSVYNKYTACTCIVADKPRRHLKRTFTLFRLYKDKSPGVIHRIDSYKALFEYIQIPCETYFGIDFFVFAFVKPV